MKSDNPYNAVGYSLSLLRSYCRRIQKPICVPIPEVDLVS